MLFSHMKEENEQQKKKENKKRKENKRNLFVPGRPPFVCTPRTHMCAHVKDPIAICRKRVGLSRWLWKHENTAHGVMKSSVAPYYGWLLAFPMHKAVIQSNLIQSATE